MNANDVRNESKVKHRSDNDDLGSAIVAFLETYYKLAVINLAKKTSSVGASVFTAVIIGFMGFFVVLFAALALSRWMGNLVNSLTGGYLITAGIFLLVMFILLLFRKKLLRPFIRNQIIRKMYD